MRDARAVENSIEDNPLHRELWEISALAGHDFIVDVVLAKRKKIAQVFAGAPRAAHDRGIAYVREVLVERIDAPVDAVITTSAGYPLDLTFYQSAKGVTAAAHIVKPGGIILLLAECREGAGAPEFSTMLKEWADYGAFLRHIEDRPVVVDQWQLEKLALVVQDRQVWFHTPGLPEEYRANLWGRFFTSASEAVETLVRTLPLGANVAVIPEGPYVLARTKSAGAS
jgi:nickel-dependent lactate racemase